MNAFQLIRQFSIRTRMVGAIALVLTLLAVVGGAGIAGMLRIEQHSQAFSSETFAQSESLSKLRDLIGHMRQHEKDMVIGYEKSETVIASKRLWEASHGEALKMATEMKAQARGEKAERVAPIIAALQAYASALAPVIRQLESGGYDTATVANKMLAPARAAILEGEKAADALDMLLHQEAGVSEAAMKASISHTLLWFGAAVVLSVVLVVPLTLINMASICRPLDEACRFADRIAAGDLSQELHTGGRDEPAALMHALEQMQAALARMVSQVRSSTDSIGTASAEIASGNQDLSQRTEQAASNLQQTASSMEQLTGTVKQSAESARQANQLASSAAAVAARGGVVVSQVVTTMDEINASSKKIADIIGVIDGIAFQTNILALNAAVEAARAGEQGRGFAVVASEVRSLAQRSAQAAKEIKGLIGASVDKVESGSRLVADAGQTMREIVGSVQRVSDMIGEITAAAAEQSDGIGQVNGAVTQLDQMTQQNAALVEQSAAAAESLKEQAVRLAGVVGTFRLDGQSQPSVAPVRTPAPASPRALPKAPPRELPTLTDAVPAAPRAPTPRPPSLPAPKPAAEDDWESF